MVKNIIVVGCNGSIAKELCKRLNTNDTNLIGISHSLELNEYIDTLFVADMNNEQQYLDTCELIAKTIRRIDGIVYCSGVTIPNAVNEMSLTNWHTTMAVNLTGYFLTIKGLYNAIIRSPGCSIVQLNSKTGKKGSYKNSAYAASKFAGIGLTQSLALELVEYGVRVNAVCPGNVFESNTWQNNLFDAYSRTQNSTPQKIREKYTDLVPMKRSCSYEDVCNVIEFLLSDKSSYMTGQAINVTGGQQLV